MARCGVVREGQRLADRTLETLASRSDRHAMAEEVGPQELRERGLGLHVTAGIADVPREAAVGIVHQPLHVLRKRIDAVASALGIDGMHPVAGVHLDPEGPRMQRREVGLDEEEAGRDARLPERAREMVVIGDVERACGPEDRGNGMGFEVVAARVMSELEQRIRATLSDRRDMPITIGVGLMDNGNGATEE